MAAEEAYPWVCPCRRLNKKSANQCAICWSHWTKGKKHDVTPKQQTYGGADKWESAWNRWDHGWEDWNQEWDDAESVGHPSSLSPRGRATQHEDYSPRGRTYKGKGKNKSKNKSKGKSESNASPFAPGSTSSAQLPSWPSWNPPELNSSPFQPTQSNKTALCRKWLFICVKHTRRRMLLQMCKRFWTKPRRSSVATTSSTCRLLPTVWITLRRR